MQAVYGTIPDAVEIWDSPVMIHKAMALLEQHDTVTPQRLVAESGTAMDQAIRALRYLVNIGCAERVALGPPGTTGTTIYRAAP